MNSLNSVPLFEQIADPWTLLDLPIVLDFIALLISVDIGRLKIHIVKEI